MSLTAVKPDQDVVDGMSLDAAWERAKLLEAERDAALMRARESKDRMDEAVAHKNAYNRAVLGLLDKYGGHKGEHPLLASLEEDLFRLYVNGPA